MKHLAATETVKVMYNGLVYSATTKTICGKNVKSDFALIAGPIDCPDCQRILQESIRNTRELASIAPHIAAAHNATGMVYFI